VEVNASPRAHPARGGDVDRPRFGFGVPEPPERRRGSVAENGAVAYGQDGGQEPSFEADVRMADGIDAAIYRMEPPQPPAVRDRVVVDAERMQLADGHDAVLPGREPGQRAIGGCSTFS
jgi:hypothetical protein